MPRPGIGLSLGALERRLGHRFTRAELLAQALTHGSFGQDHNERLEFLGDGVLGCAMAEELYARFPGLTEGKLTQLRASLVRESTLAGVARALGLGESLRLGETETRRGAEARESILADAMEAVFGAVFLDGGYDAARLCIVRAYGEKLERLEPERVRKDAKTRLGELMNARRAKLPVYRIVAKHGAEHTPTFDVSCTLADPDISVTRSGPSRLAAEQAAAQAILDELGEK
ncbi:MAG: ribonuclease III [Betaproteobacteria bacterium]